MPRGGRDRPRSARDHALGLLSRREHSARELKAKLVARGHSPDESTVAVEELRRRAWQSDERFAASLARQRAAQGYGPARIRAELQSHGVARAGIEQVFVALDVDWVAAAAAQLRRRCGTGGVPTREERMARAAFLLRRGFDAATVRRVTSADAGDPDSEAD